MSKTLEAMLNGVVSRINGFIGGINQGLEALGSERRISLVPDLDLGELEDVAHDHVIADHRRSRQPAVGERVLLP